MASAAQQYYPTYTFSEEGREVVLIEFQEALKIANNQSKVYAQVAQVLLAGMTILIPFFFNGSNSASTTAILEDNSLLFATIIAAFGYLTLRYFVELQRQITINARKVITLRAMLGLDYGRSQLTLPNWRVEGATDPFAIKFFNGWLTFQSMPFWVLAIGVNAIWWLVTRNRELIEFNLLGRASAISWFYGNAFITIMYYRIFRTNLNDTHETTFLSFVKVLAKILRFKLVDNFEYIIYRAKLDICEMSRLNVDYNALKPVLIIIEDNSFYSNFGFSFKAIARAFISHIPILKKRFKVIESGASTITMQLARTLFIPTSQNRYKRKLFEVLLAYWLFSKFRKEEILDLYIVSVRYDYGVMGLSQAIRHFFGHLKNRKLTLEESFILVERLSNVTSTYSQERIEYLASKVPGLDSRSVMDSYKGFAAQRKIKSKSK